MNSPMQAALSYAEIGLEVFPAPLGAKKSHKSKEYSGTDWGKTTDPEQIKADFKKWPNANVCIATGPGSGCFVVEADTIEGHGKDGISNFKNLIAANGDLPVTPQALSPSDSWHVFFRYPKGLHIPSTADKIAVGVDVRGEKGMVVAAPSRKPGADQGYRWLVSPEEAEFADCPEWLLELVQARSDQAIIEAPLPTASEEEIEEIRKILRSVANNLDRDEWINLIHAIKHTCGDTLRDDTIAFSYRWEGGNIVDGDPERVWDTARPYGGVGIGTVRYLLTRDLIEELTEDGVGRAFATKFAGRFRFDHEIGKWFIWTGTHWQRDLTHKAFQNCREIAREFSEPLGAGKKSAARKASFASGAERMARSDDACAVTQAVWDRDSYLLGCPGRTIDLRTGRAREPNPADGITKQTAVAPADAGCPLWLTFLNHTTGGDAALIRFLQQWCGYSLTGDTSEHALLFVFGPGGNGKSVFLETLAYILGDYATTASMDAFTAARSDKHPTDLAMLRGARLVTASETEEGRPWAEARIKQITGGDQITARFMRQDFFTFFPQFKLTLVGNHMPVLRNVDDAARRRFNIVPFTRTPAKKDKDLTAKLRSEAPAILQWMIEGCLDWQKHGLVRPQCVEDATKEYFEAQDVIGQFFAEQCEVEPGNAKLEATSADIFRAWEGFAHAHGEASGTQRRMAGALAKLGLEKGRRKEGGTTYRFWTGIALRENPNKSEFPA